jgi:hypothetical protein
VNWFGCLDFGDHKERTDLSKCANDGKIKKGENFFVCLIVINYKDRINQMTMWISYKDNDNDLIGAPRRPD